MNVFKAILLKLISALLFAVMSALVRFLGEKYPVGQIVFFRSAFAIIPVVLIYAWRNELAAAVRTNRPLGHAGRGVISIGGMFCNFAALARLPIVDATAISFAAPLITVALAAIFLKERVRIFRWSAVIVGFRRHCGDACAVFRLFRAASARPSTVLGFVFAITGAFCNAGSVIQTRRLTQTETTSSIVFYFSLICALAGLATWPFGWLTPTTPNSPRCSRSDCAAGSPIFFSPRATARRRPRWLRRSTIPRCCGPSCSATSSSTRCRPCTSIIGAAIIAAAGLFVIWRERQLGLQRVRAAEGPPTGT